MSRIRVVLPLDDTFKPHRVRGPLARITHKILVIDMAAQALVREARKAHALDRALGGPPHELTRLAMESQVNMMARMR